jgi:DNA-binding XRE family transcriptional regulator
MGDKNSMKGFRQAGDLPKLDLHRGKPRSYLEWKTLRRWDQLPLSEKSVPGYILKLVREEAGLTQIELSVRLGSSQQAVAQAERWESNPTVSFMRSWLKACGKELKIRFG